MFVGSTSTDKLSNTCVWSSLIFGGVMVYRNVTARTLSWTAQSAAHSTISLPSLPFLCNNTTSRALPARLRGSKGQQARGYEHKRGSTFILFVVSSSDSSMPDERSSINIEVVHVQIGVPSMYRALRFFLN